MSLLGDCCLGQGRTGTSSEGSWGVRNMVIQRNPPLLSWVSWSRRTSSLSLQMKFMIGVQDYKLRACLQPGNNLCCAPVGNICTEGQPGQRNPSFWVGFDWNPNNDLEWARLSMCQKSNPGVLGWAAKGHWCLNACCASGQLATERTPAQWGSWTSSSIPCEDTCRTDPWACPVNCSA